MGGNKVKSEKKKMEKEKKITILGEEVTLKFNMAVEISFEKITGKAFSECDMKMQENLVALYYACIVTNNPDTKLTIGDLVEKTSGKDIAILSTSVSEVMTAWMEPSPFEAAEEEEGDDGKNV